MKPFLLTHDAFALHRRGFLAFSLFLILVSPYLMALSFTSQVLLLGLFVLILGMPHGALDPLMAERHGIDMDTILKKAGFYLCYIFGAGIALTLWIFFPLPCLIAFIVISIIHFAEDWENDIPRWLRLLAATSLLSNPCFFFPGAVNSVFEFLAFGADTRIIVITLRALHIPVFIFLFTGLGMHSLKAPGNYLVLLEVAALHILASTFSPLVYFILYFCGLHSIRHYIETISDLKEAGFATNKIVFIIEFISVTTVLMAATIYFLAGNYQLEESILQLVFIGLIKFQNR